MNEKDLKKLYGEHALKTAPDMEKLWNRIEERIDSETDNATKETPRITQDITGQENRKKITAAKKHSGRWLAAAACIAVAVLGIRAFSGSRTDSVGKADSGTKYEAEGKTRITKTEYESLSFAYSDKKTYMDYSPDGDEYFVEQNVLEQTDVFVDCRVEKRDVRTAYCEYTLEVVNVICRTGEEVNIPKELKLVSKTPYLMNRGGEYLLPLTKSGDDYSIVFENAPQIEFTDSGEIVFHNGWSALDGESAECVYPNESINDYYYDRMRIAYTDSIDMLIREWESI